LSRRVEMQNENEALVHRESENSQGEH
jgi:hypothetical protein